MERGHHPSEEVRRTNGGDRRRRGEIPKLLSPHLPSYSLLWDERKGVRKRSERLEGKEEGDGNIDGIKEYF